MAIPPDERQGRGRFAVGMVATTVVVFACLFPRAQSGAFQPVRRADRQQPVPVRPTGDGNFTRLAERDQDSGRHNTGHIVWFFGSLLLWSLESWYWARLLLSSQLWAGNLRRWAGKRFYRVVPSARAANFSGVMPPLAIAVACFFLAPQGYDTRHDVSAQPKFVLYCFGGGGGSVGRGGAICGIYPLPEMAVGDGTRNTRLGATALRACAGIARK